MIFPENRRTEGTKQSENSKTFREIAKTLLVLLIFEGFIIENLRGSRNSVIDR